MSQSLAQIYTHFIFSTKNRKPWITPGIEADLHALLVSACANNKCFVHKIGGVEDHVHILLSLARTISVSALVADIKKKSSYTIYQK